MVNKTDSFIPFPHYHDTPLVTPPSQREERETEAFRAVEQVNLSEVKRLLSLGVDPNCCDANGKTILEVATPRPRFGVSPLSQSTANAIISELIASGASYMHTIHETYLNIFDYAFATSNFGLLFVLRQYYTGGIPIQQKSWLSFFSNISKQDFEFVSKHYPRSALQWVLEEMIQRGVIAKDLPINLIEKYEQLFLQDGTKSLLPPGLLIADSKLTKKLLESGVRVDKRDANGQNAFDYLACGIGDSRCLPLLLEKEADVCLLPSISLAFEHKNVGFLEAIQKSKWSNAFGRPALHAFILVNDLSKIEKECACPSVNLALRDLFGNTPLQTAIRHGSLEAVKLLSRYALKEDLFFASVHGSVETFSFLLPTNAVEKDFIEALFMEAREAGNNQVAAWIVQQYALQYPEVFGQYLLSKRYGTTSLALVEACVQKMKTLPDIKEDIGELLFKAVQHKQPEMADLLLKYIDDRSFFVDVVSFYWRMVNKSEQEFVEKVVKKFGIVDLFFEDSSLIQRFQEKYPDLLARLAPQLFEQGFLWCKEKKIDGRSVLIKLAVYSRQMGLVERCEDEFGREELLKEDVLNFAIRGGDHEFLASFCKKFPELQCTGFHLCGALEVHDTRVCKILVQTYKELDFVGLYHLLFYETKNPALSQEKREELFARAIEMQRGDFAKDECKELASLLIQELDANKLEVFRNYIQSAPTFSALKRVCLFMNKLTTMCKIPCGSSSTHATASWLLGEIFFKIRPKDPNLFDTICDRVAGISAPDEYGPLLEALQDTQTKELSLCAPALIRPPHVVETRDAEGKTELFRAAERGDFAEVKSLLHLGYDPNSPDAGGRTALDAVIEKIATYPMTGKVYAIIRLLVARGASCTRKIGPYLNIFDYAFGQNNFGLLFALYPYYRPHIKLSDRAIQQFCLTCELEDLEFVTKHYPGINDISMCHMFITRGRLDLLKNYARARPQHVKEYVRVKGNWCGDWSLLARAIKKGNWEIVEFLRAFGATFDNDPGLLAIDPKSTKRLLEEGMRCNEQDREGFSALHYLDNGRGDLECLPVLLQAGADPLLENDKEYTPIEFGRIEFCEIVRKSGVIKDTKSPALHAAILANDFAKIEEQLASFDPDDEDIFGYSACGLAILHRSLRAVQLLSRCTKEEDWDLEFAAAWSSVEVVSFLIEHLYPTEEKGAIITGQIYEIAVAKKNNEVAMWLLDHIDPTHSFYVQLFTNPDHEHIEKVIKKFGFIDECLKDEQLITSFWKHHLALFEQLAPGLFERAFLLCQKDNSFYPATMTLAIYSGQMDLVERCAPEANKTFLGRAIQAGNPEIVEYFCKKIRERPDEELILAIELGNDQVIQTLVQAYARRQITVECAYIYSSLLSKKASQECLIRAVGMQRSDFVQAERQEIALLLMEVAARPAAVAAIASSMQRGSTFLQLKEEGKRVITFLHKLSTVCKVPCGHLSLSKTVDWLLDQVFNHSYSMNPKLFAHESVFDTILELIASVGTNEEYGPLCVALQVAPSIEFATSAFHTAKLLAVKPSKEVFLKSPLDEQKRWLAYALVFRDRTFIPHCHHIIKHHAKYPELLIDAMKAMHKIGVKRYNDELETTLPKALQDIIQTSDDEEIKLAALHTYLSTSSPSCDLLLTQLEEARKKHLVHYETQVTRLLGTEYEWISEQECEKAVHVLLSGLQSEHEEVRFQTALTLSAIPHEQGLLAALDVVQGSTWDRMLPHYGKDRQNITGSCFIFRTRPDDIHDNRSNMVRRIGLQLIALYERKKPEMYAKIEEDPDYPEALALTEKNFLAIPPSSTRYVNKQIVYPPGTDIIRGLSTRKGGDGFRQALRDLLRKGAGSSQLTDYDTMAFSGTWNKIGHVFASHDKEIHFGNQKGSIYFSAGGSGVVTESALIIFPAAYYEKEYRAGQARLEKEGTLNNVLYRGVPHRWIKAVYLPIRYKADIELLAGNSDIKTLVFTSDLFKGDTLKELEAFRRLLTAPEIDLTKPSQEAISFVEKIRYFPAVGVKEVEKILLQDGMRFAEEGEIKRETAKLGVKWVKLSPKRFWLQDSVLARSDDAHFKANMDRFFKMLPQSSFPLGTAARQALSSLQTDGYPQFRAPLRLAALTFSFGAKAQDILAQNPRFYGLHASDIPLVVSLIEKSACSDKAELEQAYRALKRQDLTFEVYCQMLQELEAVHGK